MSYTFLISGVSMTIWKGLWQLKLVPKLKLFLWKILVNALPTRVNLVRRNLATSAICVFCREREEDIAHLFRDCPFSKRIWAASTIGLRTSQAHHLSFNDWIYNFHVFSSKNALPNFVEAMVVIMWAIWLHRNDIIFRGNLQDPLVIMQSIPSIQRRYVKERDDSLHKSPCSAPAQMKEEKKVFTKGFIDNNEVMEFVVDGAWKEDSAKIEAAVGWRCITTGQGNNARVLASHHFMLSY